MTELQENDESPALREQNKALDLEVAELKSSLQATKTLLHVRKRVTA